MSADTWPIAQPQAERLEANSHLILRDDSVAQNFRGPVIDNFNIDLFQQWFREYTAQDNATWVCRLSPT